jgi:hypothetical protein
MERYLPTPWGEDREEAITEGVVEENAGDCYVTTLYDHRGLRVVCPENIVALRRSGRPRGYRMNPTSQGGADWGGRLAMGAVAVAVIGLAVYSSMKT